MKKVAYRLCSVFLVVLMLSIVSTPCYAVSDMYTSTGTFWQAVANKWFFNGTVIPTIIGTFSDEVCSESADKKHHGSLKSYEQNSDKSYTAICNFCSSEFSVFDADLSAAYDDYVSTLPASGFNSQGNIIWQVTLSDVDTFTCDSLYGRVKISALPVDKGTHSVFAPSNTSLRFINSYTPYLATGANLAILFSFPVTGLYRQLEGPRWLVTCTGDYVNETAYTLGNWYHYSASSQSTVGISNALVDAPSVRTYVSSTLYFPTYEIIPDAAATVNNTYNTTTRPTSITGGNYGIVGDNGQITKVEDNSTIINETNNTYYNPATGQTVPITGWSYDYSDRSYKVTMEGGEISTVTYGDENISITETTINESGDTVTNNYTIYYLLDGSSSETPPCDHAWTETSITPATCTMPGSKLLTCSKCQQAKTESLSALGHDWQVKQSVTTEYDESGQLTQEGYVIYECSRCHEQYKAASGTSPPVNPSDPDASGDGVFSGIFGLLLDFLSFFWKTFKDFTKSGVKAFLGALQDGTSDIFGLLNPFDWSA